jgi:hypothetical protein
MASNVGGQIYRRNCPKPRYSLTFVKLLCSPHLIIYYLSPYCEWIVLIPICFLNRIANTNRPKKNYNKSINIYLKICRNKKNNPTKNLSGSFTQRTINSSHQVIEIAFPFLNQIITQHPKLWKG